MAGVFTYGDFSLFLWTKKVKIYTHMETFTWPVSIKNILEDSRESFCKQYGDQVRSHCFKVVNDVRQCSSKAIWFTSYKCDNCGHIKHIPFTCKSRFCNSCGKPQSDLWLQKLVSRWPQGLQYYHLAFTIPQRLRNFFKRHRKALKALPQIATQAITYFFQTKHKLTPWVLAVIHSFGAALNWNPHVHLLITAWWIDSQSIYKTISFIPYKMILPSRKKYLIKHLKDRTYKHVTNPQSEIQLLNEIYTYYNTPNNEKSWYIFFSKKAEHFKVVVRYIGRYIKRPTIAQSRIIAYDGGNVTFSYKDKRDNKTKIITTTALKFIGLLVQHIPQKNFHMVYYYWIFANRCKAKYLKILNAFFKNPPQKLVIPKSFRQRLYYSMWCDPLRCDCWWIYRKHALFIRGHKPIYFDSW